MRIELNRTASTGLREEATFRSHGILCTLRSAQQQQCWLAIIRLWGGHCVLNHEIWLQDIAASFAYRAGWSCSRNGTGEFFSPMLGRYPECSVLSPWVLLRVRDPYVELLRAAVVQKPEEYWYVRAPPKRGVKKHNLAVRYMESLCCVMCREIQELAAERCGSGVC